MKQQHLCILLVTVRPYKAPSSSLLFVGFLVLFSCLPRLSSAIVHIRGNSSSFPFIDAPARFAVAVNSSGICGALYIADPLDACSSLHNSPSTSSGFVLIERGNCAFEDKVRNAQGSGFQAAIIYDSLEKKSLISMIGNSRGIWVHAVFVTKAAGETLKKFAQSGQDECCITPSLEEAAWTVLIISFISLLVIVSVLATFFLTRNHLIHRQGTYHRCSGIDSQRVEILPRFTFNATCQGGRSIGETCAICLEDYRDGESLRLLPCRHDPGQNTTFRSLQGDLPKDIILWTPNLRAEPISRTVHRVQGFFSVNTDYK